MILRALVAARVQGQHFKVDQAAQRAGQTLFFHHKSRSDSPVYRRARSMTHPGLYHPYGNGARACLVILLLVWGNPCGAVCCESHRECW